MYVATNIPWLLSGERMVVHTDRDEGGSGMCSRDEHRRSSITWYDAEPVPKMKPSGKLYLPNLAYATSHARAARSSAERARLAMPVPGFPKNRSRSCWCQHCQFRGLFVEGTAAKAHLLLSQKLFLYPALSITTPRFFF